MRFALVLATLAIAACSADPTSNTRGIRGTVEEGTLEVVAFAPDGRDFRATPREDLTFSLDLPTTLPVHVFTIRANEVRVVRFASTSGGAPDTTRVPNSDGSVSFGILCDDED